MTKNGARLRVFPAKTPADLKEKNAFLRKDGGYCPRQPMMLNRSYSSLTMKKRAKRRDWRAVAIFAILALGLGLVILAFALRDEESDIPDAPETRNITAHVSADIGEYGAGEYGAGEYEAGEYEAGAFDPAPDLERRAATDLGAQKRPADEKQKTLPGAPAQIPPPPGAPDKSRQARAMADLARIPAPPGASAPKLGFYRMRNAGIVYDSSASPEEILRDQSTRYTVVSGDIIGRIAQKFGCSAEQIQKANHMTDDKIKIGQKLLIPNCRDAGSDGNR